MMLSLLALLVTSASLGQAKPPTAVCGPPGTHRADSLAGLLDMQAEGGERPPTRREFLDTLRHALSYGPLSEYSGRRMQQLARYLNARDEAHALVRLGFKRWPLCASSFYTMALSFIPGDLDSALFYARAAVRLFPDSLLAWATLGGIEADAGLHEAALAAYDHIMTRDSFFLVECMNARRQLQGGRSDHLSLYNRSLAFVGRPPIILRPYMENGVVAFRHCP
jgi:tetratricopeptide (TPR) repeat protein